MNKSPTPPTEHIETLVKAIRDVVNRPPEFQRPGKVVLMKQALAEMGVNVTIEGTNVTWSLQ